MVRRRLSRCALAVILVAGATGCATYRTAHVPGSPRPAADRGTSADAIYVGASARAVLRNGEKISGNVAAVTDSSVTFGRIGNDGLSERVVAASDLEVLEIEDQSGAVSQSITKFAVGAMAHKGLFLLMHPTLGSN
ncbi:MAG: hypothetical protein IPJ24_17475 [bacterium]|nr:hypothetical protein [bacterium]